MKGHIEQRQTKKKLPRSHHRWSIIIETGRGPTGVRGRKRYTFYGTKTDAESELGRKLHQLETGALVLHDHYTVAEYLRHWLDAYAKPSTAPRTYERYEQLVNTHLVPKIGNHKLVKLTPLHLLTLYSELLKNGRKDGNGGLSPQTVTHIHRVLHMGLKQALLWGSSCAASRDPRCTSLSCWRFIPGCAQARFWGSAGRMLTLNREC